MNKITEDVRTLIGYIVPILTGGEEHSSTVALAHGDTEYFIEPRGAGIDLADQMNVRVEARGAVREKDGVFLLHIRSYRLLDDFDSEWYDDENASS